jgi:mono/diheme cytochrome c family protein
MLSTIALVAALSTGHKIGLACVGIAFIVFALVSAMVVPRRYPDFPGRHLGLYIVVCVLFFLAMIAAVLVFGREPKEASATETPTTSTSPAPAPSTTGETTTSQAPAPSTSTTTGAPQGDPAAGKAVFTSAGCTGCHTLKAAGSSGTVGPNLDNLKPDYATIVHQVENGGGGMPSFKDQLSPKQISDVAAFVFTSTHS